MTIVGLGPGDVDDLTRRAWRTLEAAQTVYLRTSRHPCVPHLPQTATYHNFDDLYDAADDFVAVYDTIVQRLTDAARDADVVYAVPGDPLVGESTVPRLMQIEGLDVTIVNGVSFIEPTLKMVGVDALDNLQVLDAITVAAMHHPPIKPDAPALLGQVYSQAVASDLKLTLMNQYPDEFEVTLVHGAGTDDAITETLPLYEIDRSPHIAHLTSLYLPPLDKMASFERFQETIAHLRAPEGCPWDREQTHLSLRNNLIEEAYEVLEAIDEQDPDALYEEMGDLLLQIVLHTQIAIDDGEFYMSDVISSINRKLIRRHPHVWGDVNVDGAEAVTVNWEQIKQQENAEKGKQRESRLDGVPKALPALLQAYNYGRKAAKVGFDWHRIDDVLAKIHEEMNEVATAPDDNARANEIGDLLFAVVNWSRWLKIEPESALREANARFYRRFRFVEESAKAGGKPLDDYTLDELDAFWNAAKANGL